jgi:hypothetical protein
MLTPETTRSLAKASGKQPETMILRAVRDYLRIHRWYVVRIQQGMGCHKGVSDLVAVRDGRTVWIEVKTPTGRQSEAQRVFEHEIDGHGGEYHVVRSVEDAAAISGEELLC